MSIEEEFIKAVKDGRNCFLTGGGGVGKTYLVNKMKTKIDTRRMVTTATTGLAALHVGGTTIHSFSGMGVYSNVTDIKSVTRGDKWFKASDRICNAKIIIIDEISMLAGDQLDLLDLIFRKATRNPFLSFGGKQIIFVGDLLQLPPVVIDSERKQAMDYNYWPTNSLAWKEADIKTFNLLEVKRQNEVDTINALNEIRFGRVGILTKTLFQSREDAKLEGTEEAVRLMPTNKEVDKINRERLAMLDSPLESIKGGFTYNTKIESDTERARLYYQITKNCTAPEVLDIKVNSRVIMLKNNPEEGYVNGSMGTFLEHAYYLDTSLNKYEEAEYCLQDCSIPFIDTNDYGSEACEERRKRGIDSNGKLILTKEAVELVKKSNYRDMHKWSPQEYLLVKLDCGELVYVLRSSFSLKTGDYRCEFTEKVEDDVVFHQFPMRLAWAITIHKSQGMTLDNVEIHMNRIFSEGQAYVALSRAKSIWGIRIIGWCPSKVMANHDAVNFYNQLILEEADKKELIAEDEFRKMREGLDA